MIYELFNRFKAKKNDPKPLLTMIEELKAVNNYILFEHEQTKRKLAESEALLEGAQIALNGAFADIKKLRKKQKRKKKNDNTKTALYKDQLSQPRELNEHAVS